LVGVKPPGAGAALALLCAGHGWPECPCSQGWREGTFQKVCNTSYTFYL